jgi:large subunit ribosomal protein L29
MKYKELKNNNPEQLKKMLSDMREELHGLSVKTRLGEHKQTHKLKGLKKDIARIMTLLAQK